MKMFVGFLIGIIATLAIVLAVTYFGSPVVADTTTTTTETDENPDYNTMMPDVRKIYHTCLTAPFQQAEIEIHDPAIANYYHKLMQETGLTKDYDDNGTTGN
jgi:hypothetical protein